MYRYSHGGDIYLYEDRRILDFSANINPLGLPQGVKRAMVQAVDSCDIYPDPFCRKLRKAISQWEGIPFENIYCSNGAADLIDRLILGLKPKKALLAVPSFGEYERALNRVDCKITYFYMTEEEEFKLTNRFLECLSPEIDLIFICNPNNPTGHLIDETLLQDILEYCEKNDIYVIMDECFIDFLAESEQVTIKRKIHIYQNLVVMKAFTKLFAMAGIRLGYCFTANKDILDKLYQSGQPWAVSNMAQQAGIAAVKEQEYIERAKAMTEAQSSRLKRELTKLGYRVYDSRANFIFFYAKDCNNLKEVLLSDNILIRNCDNYKGLHEGYYRIAIKRPYENELLLDSLKKRMD